MINIIKAPKSKKQNYNKDDIKTGLKCHNVEKKNKNFMYKNLEQSDCHNCDFAYSNFDYASFRGANFKSSNFEGCSFNFTEFIETNFKNSSFKGANLKNALFNLAKIEGVSFKGAIFENTIFLDTDISKAKNLDINTVGVTVLKNITEVEASEELTVAIINAMNNKYIKNSRVLDTIDGGINMFSVKLLLDNFEENKLIKSLNYMSENLDEPFYTLSYLIKAIMEQQNTW